MGNPWKWIALGMMAVVGIVATSSLTTAYLMRPPALTPTATTVETTPAVEHRAPAISIAPVVSQKPIRRVATATRPPVTRVVAPQPAVAPGDETTSVTPVPAATAPAPTAASVTSPPTAPTPAVPVAAAPSLPSAPARPADCDSGGDRALRVAKPGVLGALLGAGLGAAGGAIANGGKGAGKGALIGGVAGAALGTGYGAYKTKNDCGTIFGSGERATSSVTGRDRVSGTPIVAGPTTGRDEVAAPLQASDSAQRIQVYGVR
jgi:hypothetical protein